MKKRGMTHADQQQYRCHQGAHSAGLLHRGAVSCNERDSDRFDTRLKLVLSCATFRFFLRYPDNSENEFIVSHGSMGAKKFLI